VPSAAETALQRKATTDFISYDSTEVILNRPTKEDNEAGGYREADPIVLPSQTMRLIRQAVAGRLNEVSLIDGTVVEETYHLLGEWDADVERGDFFFLGLERYEVAWVTRVSDYETKAGVANRG
jgi:hypothetical protein